MLRAEVRVDGGQIDRMGPGLLALVGVAEGDTLADAQKLADKLLNLRVFEDAQGRMNRALVDVGGVLGVVSQFTLLGDCRKGRRPSYARAAAPELAESRIDALIDAARGHGVEVMTGRFGARMEVELVNAGPVTLLLDTRGAI